MADKMVKVATPTVAAVNEPSADVQQLKAEVSCLVELMASLSQRDRHPRCSRSTSQHRRPPKSYPHGLSLNRTTGTRFTLLVSLQVW